MTAHRQHRPPLETRALRQHPQKWIAGGFAALFLVVAAVVAWSFWTTTDESSTLADRSSVTDAASQPQPSAAVQDETLAAQDGGQDRDDGDILIVADDGRLPWASPTSGAAISAIGLPFGTQAVLHLHPTRWQQDESSRKVLQALGPDVNELLASWRASTGLAFAQLQDSTIAVISGGENRPKIVSRVVFNQPLNATDTWPDWQVVEADKQLYRAGKLFIWLTAGAANTITSAVIGPEAPLRELAVTGQPVSPPLTREFSQLLEASDADRDFTLIVTPSLLFAEGRNFYFAGRPELAARLQEVWAGQIQATLLSLNTDDLDYWEIRLAPTAERRVGELEGDLRRRWEQLPLQVSDFLGAMSLQPAWQKLALRFPTMVRYLADHSRVGSEQRQLVINGVLPAGALHNVILASEFATLTESNTTAPAVGESPADGPPQPQSANTAPATLADVLNFKTSFSVPQQSLEFAISDFASQLQATLPSLPFQLQIEINGKDLQLEGITRNQQIRNFAAQNSSVADILTGLVMKANPVTTVTNPNEEDQKLVWIVASNKILITTRATAKSRQMPLPAAFRAD